MEGCTKDGVCEVTEAQGSPEATSYIKERYGDTLPICYCFHLFKQDIEQEIRRTGKTTIPDFVKAQVRAGNCRCEHTNPKKTCCLGDLSKAVANAGY